MYNVYCAHKYLIITSKSHEKHIHIMSGL